MKQFPIQNSWLSYVEGKMVKANLASRSSLEFVSGKSL